MAKIVIPTVNNLDEIEKTVSKGKIAEMMREIERDYPKGSMMSVDAIAQAITDQMKADGAKDKKKYMVKIGVKKYLEKSKAWLISKTNANAVTRQ